MNDTNNVNNNPVEAQTPVEAVPVTPTVSETPVAPAVSTPETPETVPTEQPVKEEPNKEENKNNNEEEYVDETLTGKKRFPFAIVIIIVLLIIFVFVYYFFWITPARVFDKAINNIVDSVKEAVNGLENSEHDVMNLQIDTELKTSGPNTINDPNIDFVDGLKVGADITLKMKDFNFGVLFNSNLNNLTPSEEDMEYTNQLDIGFDYVDKNFYLKSKDVGEGEEKNLRTAKYSLEDGALGGLALDYSRITDAVEAFEMMKDKVLKLVDDSKLDRNIVVKKIKALEDEENNDTNNQTALAIKVHTKLNYDEIADIYEKGFSQLYDNEEYINKLSNAFSMSTDEIKELIDKVVNRKTVTENIEINLYMNLANSKLIGLDVTVDKYFFELNYLNGYYYIDIKIKDNELTYDILDVEISYDNYLGILDINAEVVMPDQTYLNVDAIYTRKTSDNSSKMSGNTLDISFYGEETKGSGVKAKKPFCTFNFELDIAYDDEISKDAVPLVDPKEAIAITDLNSSEIEHIQKSLKKILYEYFFVYGRLMLNREYTAIKEYSLSKSDDIDNIVAKLISGAAGSISYSDLLKYSVEELKDKMKILADFDAEKKSAAYVSIVNNIKNGITFDEITKMEYATAEELLKTKLSLLDQKYRTDVLDAVTEIIVKNLTYEKITSMTLDEEKELLKKANLLPETNQKTIFNHIIDEVKANVTYDKMLTMSLDEVKDLLSRVEVIDIKKYRDLAYSEVTSMITSNLKYDEIVKMSNDEIKGLMEKVKALPSASQKTVLAKVAEVIDKKVTYAYMLDLKLADEKELLAKVELLPNKDTVYSNIGKAVVKGLTAKEMATIDANKIDDLLAKVELLPASTQKTINAQIVKASKELMANLGKYNVTTADMLPKVCKLPNDTVKAIVGADKSAICK